MDEELYQSSEPLTSNAPQLDSAFPITTINGVKDILNQIPHTPQVYDPILISHPLFQHEEDPLLSSLTSTLKSLISQKPDPSLLKAHSDSWLNLLIEMVFDGAELGFLKEEFKKLGLSFDTICGKFIGPEEIYFRCLDCDRFKDTTSSIYALLCSQCFDNSNHEGHRVLMVKKDSNCSATCDCGDHTAFDPTGFCRDHQPKEFCSKETLSKFPQDFLRNCFIVLKNAFYGVICLFEVANAAPQDYKAKEALSAFAQMTLEGTLIFCNICYGEINEAFLIVFAELFQCTFYEDYNAVWHYCDDTTAEKGVRAVDITNPHECSCTIVGNLLRIGNIVEFAVQMKLHKVIVECAKESNFKLTLLKEFTKYIHFLYSQTYTSDEFDDNSNSRLLNMKAQLYGSEELCLEVLNSEYFNNLANVMRQTIKKSFQANHEVYHIVSDIRCALIYFLNPKSKTSNLVVRNTPLLAEVLNVLTNFQLKFVYEGEFHVGLFDHQIDYRCINRSLMIEKVILQVLEQGVRLISDSQDEEKLTILKNFTRQWLQCFETSKAILSTANSQGVVSFNPALERTLTSMVRLFSDDLTEESVTNFFKITLPETNVHDLAAKVVEGALRSLGMIRFIHLVHNFNSGKIWHVYYFSNNLFFEMDILTIQTMTTVIEPSKLFEVFISNFFSYNKDLQGFFSNPESLSPKDDRYKQKLLVLEDFLHLIIYVMHDETARLNSKVCKDIHLASEETQLSIKCHGVIEKVLINLLLGHYWVDVPQLKESMKNVLISHSDVDDILHKVAIIDDKNKKVRIKPEYQKELDPYIFYRNPALQSEINHNVASMEKKGEKIDLVSGKFYKDLPCYLKVIQKKIYQSSLPDHLALFLYRFQAHTASLVRPVLKLILLNLQVVEESLKADGCDLLKANIQKNYLNQAFTNRLSDLRKNSDFKDCELCIEKIQKLVESLSSQLQNGASFISESKEVSNHEEQLAHKKKLAHQRMLQLKEEFMKKQKMFMNKHAVHSHENLDEIREVRVSSLEQLEESIYEEENGLTCQFCLDKISKSSEAYGIPIYVAFTNNLYDIEETTVSFHKAENPERLEGNWWPVISSCMHHYHEKCFQSHHKNTRKEPDAMGRVFNSKLETFCSLCGALCNAFVLEDESKNTKMPNQEDNSQTIVSEEDEKLEHRSFVETIQALVESTREKIKLDPQAKIEGQKSVTVEELFRKGHAYFLESFHVTERVIVFEKAFFAYKAFLKEYSRHLIQNGSPSVEVPSLFSQIFSNGRFCTASEPIKKRLIEFSEYKAEPLLNNISFDLLMNCSISQLIFEDTDHFQEHMKVLKEYIAYKFVQVILFCKEPSPIAVSELYALYQEDEELREDVIDEVVFPIQKFILATYLNKSILNGEETINETLFEVLLDPEDNLAHYLDVLVKCAGVSENFDQLVKTSLEDLETKEPEILNSLREMLASDTTDIALKEPQSVKLAPKMIELPANYLDFISTYLKKKCSQCNEYTKHMTTSICLICGDVICLSYCDKDKQKRGNLNRHAKQCHLGLSAFIEIQRASKSLVACSKNSMHAGKEMYTDKLGQSIQTLINDPRSLLYSLDFEKFTLNEDFVKTTEEMIEHCSMGREIYKITKGTGYYYAEGNL